MLKVPFRTAFTTSFSEALKPFFKIKSSNTLAGPLPNITSITQDKYGKFDIELQSQSNHIADVEEISISGIPSQRFADLSRTSEDLDIVVGPDKQGLSGNETRDQVAVGCPSVLDESPARSKKEETDRKYVTVAHKDKDERAAKPFVPKLNVHWSEFSSIVATPNTGDLMKTLPEFDQPLNGRLSKVAIIGAANAGKSTILNRLVGRKISIASTKAQTTRHRITGILTDNETQLIFLDTPGVPPIQHRSKVGVDILEIPWDAVSIADHILWVIDASRGIRSAEMTISERLNWIKARVTVVFNKCDLMEISRLKELSELRKNIRKRMNKHGNLKCIMMSTFRKQDMADLKELLLSSAPRGEWVFSPQVQSLCSRVDMVNELIREKIYKTVKHEIPYYIKQETYSFVEFPEEDKIEVRHRIYVKCRSHMAAILGAECTNMRNIIEKVSGELTREFKRRVLLNVRLVILPKIADSSLHIPSPMGELTHGIAL